MSEKFEVSLPNPLRCHKVIQAHSSAEEVTQKAMEVADAFGSMKLSAVCAVLCQDISRNVTYCRFPRKHYRNIRTNNVLERILNEIRRRRQVVSCFHDGKNSLMLIRGRLRYVASKS
ncbi:transposase [Pelagicoccus sp. SDUM812002]|uniref:transposase n=1 Tax=Pelagicoccus sp. SDUM812002 TaxID=3041266 RepID=UPI0034E19B86